MGRNGWISRHIQWYRIERKNDRIRENLDEFLVNYSVRSGTSREDRLLPEIIIPCYNHGCYLRDALSSCPRNVPVTISFDPSTDDSEEIIECLQGDFNFKLIKGLRPEGQGESLNRAIRDSPNNLFMILNADDCLIEDALDSVMSVFARYPDVRLVGGSCIPFHDATTSQPNSVSQVVVNREPKADIFTPSTVRNVTNLNDVNMTMSSSAFTKSAWEAVDGFWPFERRVCSPDDRDFQLRVGSLFPIAIIREPLAYYRTNSSLKRGQS